MVPLYSNKITPNSFYSKFKIFIKITQVYNTFSIIIICMILWLMPGVRSKLIDFYENNFVVKLFIDLIISII